MQHRCDFYGCNASFSRPGRLNIHKLTHTSFRPFKCTIPDCGKAYQSSQHLKRHVKNKHETRSTKSEEIWVCYHPGCSKVIHTSWGYYRHLVKHDKDEGVQKQVPFCEQCQRTFRFKSVLKKHKKRVHKVVPCDEDGCSETFSNLNLLKSHVASHHKLSLTYTCDYCKREYKGKSNIRTHIINMHLSDERCRWICTEDKCGKQFRCEKYLMDHIDRMHQENEFICDVEECKKECRGKLSLERHKLSHIRKDKKKKMPYAKKLAYMLTGGYYYHNKT